MVNEEHFSCSHNIYKNPARAKIPPANAPIAGTAVAAAAPVPTTSLPLTVALVANALVAELNLELKLLSAEEILLAIDEEADPSVAVERALDRDRMSEASELMADSMEERAEERPEGAPVIWEGTAEVTSETMEEAPSMMEVRSPAMEERIWAEAVEPRAATRMVEKRILDW